MKKTTALMTRNFWIGAIGARSGLKAYRGIAKAEPHAMPPHTRMPFLVRRGSKSRGRVGKRGNGVGIFIFILYLFFGGTSRGGQHVTYSRTATKKTKKLERPIPYVAEEDEAI